MFPLGGSKAIPVPGAGEVGTIDIPLAPVTAAVKSILKPLVVVYISEFIEF
jgi:hypothetical protein